MIAPTGVFGFGASVLVVEGKSDDGARFLCEGLVTFTPKVTLT